MNQYLYVRTLACCPSCGKPKPAGTILCWPCHHSQKRFNDGGYSKRLTAKLETLERNRKTASKS